MELKYTHKDFKNLKKELKITNSDIALATGLTADSVKNQTAPAKLLPTWVKAMLYIHQLNKEKPLK